MKLKETVFLAMAFALIFATSEQNLPLGSAIICFIVSIVLFFFSIPEEMRKSAAIYWFEQRKQKGGRKNG